MKKLNSTFLYGIFLCAIAFALTLWGSGCTTAQVAPTPVATPAPTPTPTPTPTPQPLTLQSSGLEKPLPGSTPTLSATQTLTLAQGETGGFIAEATGPSGCVALPTLPNGLTIQAFQMRTVTTTTPSSTSSTAGTQYDPLYPATQVCSGSWYWFDVGATASSTVNFLGLALTVNLASWQLPSTPTMPLYIGIEPMKIFAAHGLPSTANVTSQWPILQSYLNLLRAHRIEPIDQMLANPPVVDGAMNLDEWSAGSFRQTEMTGSIAPVCVRAPTATTSTWASGTELSAWQTSLGVEPLLANAWAFITDEPTDLTGTATRAQLVRTNAPGLKVMVTHEPTTALLPLVDHFTTVFEYFNASGHWTDFSAATLPEGYWLYGGCMSHGCAGGGTLDGTPDLMLDEPTVNARAYPAVAYTLGANGELYYDAVYSIETALQTAGQYAFGGNGDGNLVYPCSAAADPTDCPTDSALPSIRLKMLRQGLNDIEWANHLGVTLPVTSQTVWSQSNSAYDGVRQ